MIPPGVKHGIGPRYKVHATGRATRVGNPKDEWATWRTQRIWASPRMSWPVDDGRYAWTRPSRASQAVSAPSTTAPS
jgi:hypothetical protein